MYISLDVAKEHLNIDKDFDADNEYILHLIQAAEDAIAKRLNIKSLTYLVNHKTGYLPDSTVHSILLLVGNWYAARETFTFQSANKLPHSFDFLVDLNRNYKEPF